jgi:mannosyltransferase OCH1-like enzyme
MGVERNLYQIWYQGEDNITKEKYVKNMMQWRLLNPDWNYELLDATDLRSACEKYSSLCLKAYDRTQNMHTRIDLGRLVKIYQTGGMNVDMDMYILRPISYQDEVQKFLNDASKQHNFAVSSLKTLNTFENLVVHGKTTSSFNNAMTVSSKGNPVLKYVIDKYIGIILSLTEANGGMMYVDKTTGPRNFNKFVIEATELFKDTVNFKVFDGEIFEPCNGDHMCAITDNTIAIHNFDWSWIDPRLAVIFKFYLQNRLVVYILIVFLLYKLIKAIFF